MGIYVIQPPKRHRKYRVARSIKGEQVEKQFPYTEKGYAQAQAYDERLRARQLASSRAKVLNRVAREKADKLFNTGVVGVRVRFERNSPSFQLSVLKSGTDRLYMASRAMRRHGYESAWEQIIDLLWAYMGYTAPQPAPQPAPPNKKKVKRYLRSLGAIRGELEF